MRDLRPLNYFETACVVGHDVFHGAFNMLAAFTVSGRFDRARVRESLAHLHRNHQILRCTIVEREGEYRFVERDNFARVPLRFETVDGAAAATAWMEAEVDTTFDYGAYVWRFALLEQPDDFTTVVFGLHHALGDGVVLLGFCREFFETYVTLQAGGTPVLGDFRFERDLEDVLETEQVNAAHDVGPGDARARRMVPVTHAAPTDRHTRLGTLKIDREHEEDIKRVCRARGITMNSYLGAAILRALAEQLGQDVAVILNTPFNVVAQHLVEKGPHEDFGYGVGIVVQQFERILDRDFFSLAADYGTELKEKIAAYKIPMTAEDRLKSARDYIDEELERPKAGEMPIEVMLSNVGRFSVPAEFTQRVENTYITGGRRAGDQLFLIVPIAINDELFVPIAHTEPFFSRTFAAEFRERFRDNLLRFSQA